jgi:hypothetical protein
MTINVDELKAHTPEQIEAQYSGSISLEEKQTLPDNFRNNLQTQLNQLESMVLPKDYEQYLKDVNNMVQKYDCMKSGVVFENTLFSVVGLCWINGQQTAMNAKSRTFDSKEKRSEYLKVNRPLVYWMEDFEPLPTLTKEEVETIRVFYNPHYIPSESRPRYLLRTFPEIGKLSWYKYHLQFLVEKWHPKFLRPFLYNLLATK